MSDFDQQLKRMHAVASSVTAHEVATQTLSHRKIQQDNRDDTTTEDAVQEVTSIKDNTVYQIMGKTSLSRDEQINAIAQYLTVQNDDYVAARRHFAEFQAYFNYVQEQGMKTDVKGLESLIAEVKSSLKPEIERIVTDVVEVQNGTDESKRLLAVMRTARLEGKSIEQIKAAIDLNDQILAAIADLNETITLYQNREAARQGDLDNALDRKLDSEKGFWNSVKRSVTGPDKEIAADIADAQEQLQKAQGDIEKKQTQLKEKQAERNTNLESGPLTILRSIDATDDGFAQNIVTTAENSLKLIQGASTSVQRLLKRTAYSKDQALKIHGSISKAEVKQAIMEGAIQRVVKIAHDQSEVVKENLVAQDQKLSATDDTVEKAVLNAERVEVAEVQKSALAYEEDVKRAHSNFTMTTANTVEAQSRSAAFYNQLLAQEDLLQEVAARALPETARALRLGLEVNVGMQTSELASSIHAVTRHAMEIGQGSYKDAAVTRDEVRADQLKSMQDAIDALTAAEESVVTAAEADVKHSDSRANLTGGLKKATSELRTLLEQYDDIRARTADPAPTATYVPDLGVGAPARPQTPANDAAPTAKVAGGPGA